MLQDLQNILQFSLSPGEVIRNLSVALICGLLISWFYRKAYHGPGYLNTFVNSMVILAMITAVVIMVIGNNLARAFGLVGAMSIIRFRTALKETQDIIFIFFTLAIGMAAGVGLYAVAFAGTFFIGTVALSLAKTSLISSRKREFLLQFVFSGDERNTSQNYETVLAKYCKTSRLINAKSAGTNGDLELSFYVTLKHSSRNTELISELKKLYGVSHVNMFFDEEYF
jgi:uncharacterized membrane protein YhiD involved in acid resistance